MGETVETVQIEDLKILSPLHSLRISFINLIFITKEQSFITHLNNRETNYQLLDINIRVMSWVIGYDVLVIKNVRNVC